MKPSKTSLNQIGVSASLWMKKLGFVWLLCGASCWSEAAVVFVRADQTNSTPDGISWTTAYRTVQAGINAGSEGDAVWVAAGTYYENLTLSNGVALYGGFVGVETDLGQRDWKSRFSILDGRQSNSVIRIIGGTNTTRVDGFVVRNGYASYGGGINCSVGSPVIVNNAFIQNYTDLWGWGGAIHCYEGVPVIASNLIQANWSYRFGAGINTFGSSPKIQRNRICGISARSEVSAAIFCSSGGSPEISDNLILGCSISGIDVTGTDAPRIVNNTVLWCQGYHMYGIQWNTNLAVVANNLVAFCNSGFSGVEGTTFRNNCAFSNYYNYTGFADPTGFDGNIAADPNFVPNGSYPDIHLSAASPCIDAGDSDSVLPGALDLDGETRVIVAAVDIGADEFNGATPVFEPTIVRVKPDGDDRNDGSTWAAAKKTVQAGIYTAMFSGGELWVRAGTYSENLVLRQGVHLFGGFAGIETSRSQRNWAVNTTILDGNRSGSVITLDYLLQWNAIDGFVIRNGKASAGGGIYCHESASVITHNLITGNVATNGSNSAKGGGIYVNQGLFNQRPTVIAYNVISSNQAVSGGGICDKGFASQDIVEANFFSSNVASDEGGAIYGEVTVYYSARPRISNNTMIQNLAKGLLNRGGGICSDSAIIANNLIVYGSSGIYGSSSNVQNNCVYANTQNYNQSDLTGMNGNISVDPLLVSSNDYHFAAQSPCINAGNNALVSLAADLDGNPRIAGGTVDIGAYEFQTPASLLSYAWLQQYGLPTDGSADFADTDGDCLNSWQEWRAGTVPTNAASVLKLLPPVPGAGGTLVSWQSVSGRTYLLERSTNLAAQPAFSTVQSHLAGVDGITSCSDTNAVGDGPCFYRIGLQQ